MPTHQERAPLVLIPAVFFGLAAWFFVGSGAELPEMAAPAEVAPEDIDPAPARTVSGDRPSIIVGGHAQRCSDCHRLFDSPQDGSPELLQHTDIVLDHGMNDRCLNCHSQNDRDKLVLHGEREIGFDEVALLCAKCHGPTFRDWEHGMHGRTMGTWDASLGNQTRLGCTQCHDPHAPAFEPVVPLPGPDTLRMGDPHSREHPPIREDRQSPLMKRIRSDDPHAEKKP